MIKLRSRRSNNLMYDCKRDIQRCYTVDVGASRSLDPEKLAHKSLGMLVGV